ncbi:MULTISPECIES: replication initiation protein [Burkholderia cepacia complex]|uniref:Replication initiation protein RepB n=1 Tax=Medicago truncatula TaxID=3880 RepID=A0A072TCR2_MEDTR|nr:MULTISPECIES: replication initiation protein [Burkholderia cepacia complex]KEH15329.1 replication initiation protein RepB [Medicago truncatula]MBR8426354.1 replication initiation protein [Burkholderia cenocepacia]MBR8494754.1 replication initiation protein [Burkholderia cenocepacia]MCA8081423.1 replication initiation protein [Burkholderia cepacia]
MPERSQLATSQQLALELFSAAADEGYLPIETASTDIGFLRNNLLVRILDLTVLGRRLIDAAYFIVAQRETEEAIYDEDLGFFKWLMRYPAGNSNRNLRDAITAAQKALIQVSGPVGSEDALPFGSLQLINRVSIEDGRIRFRVPPEIIPLLRGPQKTHWLSLRVTTQFNTTFARVLYDHLMPYASEEEVVTDYFSTEEMKGWLDSKASGPVEYKYFNRDHIEPAIKQINQHSHLEINRLRSDTKNVPGSRKTGFTRFRIKRKAALDALFHVSDERIEAYRLLMDGAGLSQTDIDTIDLDRTFNTVERLRNAYDYTKARAKQGKLKTVRGYCLDAIKNGYKLSELERVNAQAQQILDLDEQQKETEGRSREAQRQLQVSAVELAASDRVASESEQGISLFVAASPNQQDEWFRDFVHAPTNGFLMTRSGIDKATATIDNILAAPLLRSGLGQSVFMKSRVAARKGRGA